MVFCGLIELFFQFVICGCASHSRPFSMASQYKGGKTRSFKYRANMDGFVPSMSHLGKLGATLPP
jgi:hypothetical protein